MNKLAFSLGNAKLAQGHAIFDLPAGHSCPFAHSCQSFADRVTGRIKDGLHTQFRCYAASSETRPAVRARRWANFEAVKGKNTKQIFNLIETSMPTVLLYRIHSSGDFFNQTYFDAWLEIARAYPERIFYAYTKALPFWIRRLGDIPPNFRLTASIGGTHDYLIAKYGLKSVRVVYSEKEAADLNLEIDHDDSHAWNSTKSFALLIHGTQPAGSPASKAWAKLKFTVGGYNRS